MELWNMLFSTLLLLRPAFPRQRTFLWYCTALCGFCIRTDLLGVTSFVRCLGLHPCAYDRLLDMFHCSGLDFRCIRKYWMKAVLEVCSNVLWKVNGRIVILGDGVKIPKSGKKMPGVKKLHQESESNTKPEYIFGHNLQAVSIVAKVSGWLTAIPLGAEIHDGVVFSNRCCKTLLDRMLELIQSLGLEIPAYYVLDAYYGAEKIITGALVRNAHLVTRLRRNSVTYLPPLEQNTGRGRKRKYGQKIKVSSLFDTKDGWHEIECMLYGKMERCKVQSFKGLWRSAGREVLYVLVQMEHGGKVILMSTDIELAEIDIIQLYGARFKIEVGFKTSIRIVGALSYHFWMFAMKPIGRKGKNQYMHRESEEYRNAVRRKLSAYHNFIQCGIIAHGLMTILAILKPCKCWFHFGSWMRTINLESHPSEWVVSQSLKNTFPQFLAVEGRNNNWLKFLMSIKAKDEAQDKVA